MDSENSEDHLEALVRRAEKGASDPDPIWQQIGRAEAGIMLQFLRRTSRDRTDLIERCSAILNDGGPPPPR